MESIETPGLKLTRQDTSTQNRIVIWVLLSDTKRDSNPVFWKPHCPQSLFYHHQTQNHHCSALASYLSVIRVLYHHDHHKFNNNHNHNNLWSSLQCIDLVPVGDQSLMGTILAPPIPCHQHHHKYHHHHHLRRHQPHRHHQQQQLRQSVNHWPHTLLHCNFHFLLMLSSLQGRYWQKY